MSGREEPLEVGWQSRPALIAAVAGAAVLAGLAAGARFGAIPGLTVLLAGVFAAMARLQWAALEGSALQLRDARSGYVFRLLPARNAARLRFRRSPLPWCRLTIERDAAGLVLVLIGPSARHPTLRAVTLWMIVHGRRRTRIDPRLLDALAAMPEHGAARQPHDASHA